MGTSRTPDEFRRKIASLPEVVIEAEREAVLANAKLAKQNALTELRRHVPSQRLKNVGKNGSKLNARYRIDSALGRSADIKAVGQWQFVENDARNVPYGVGSKYAGGSRKSRSKAVLEGKYSPGGQFEKFRSVKGEDGTRSKVSKGNFGGRRAMIRTPWGWRAYSKITKKRRGKHPWRTAFLKTQREAPQAYQKAAEKALRKALRG